MPFVSRSSALLLSSSSAAKIQTYFLIFKRFLMLFLYLAAILTIISIIITDTKISPFLVPSDFNILICPFLDFFFFCFCLIFFCDETFSVFSSIFVVIFTFPYDGQFHFGLLGP
ncbi:MAG: hypothetical protein [Bacteriophage sp.]|nr:MAG: hypothetical protein [Bacteriophage sp.]